MRVYLEAYILKIAVFLWLLCGCLSVAACQWSLYVFMKLCVCGCVSLWSLYVLKKLCVTCVSVAVWLRFSVCLHCLHMCVSQEEEEEEGDVCVCF